MTKAELMKYVGNYVKIKLFDDTLLEGTLGYTSKFCEEDAYRKPNFFYIGDYCFRVSHVKKLMITGRMYFEKFLL